MDEGEQLELKRLNNEEDEATARKLAAALCEDNVDKFLELYDEIPAGISHERIGNIKEMARQLAALTRNTSYRCSPTPVKDTTYFGVNHVLQSTPLMVNGQLSTSELSAFKTPPEGLTPVDQKKFDFDEGTLKTLSSLYEHLNDSGIIQQECLTEDKQNDDVDQCLAQFNNEATKPNDDDTFEFHTPPEDLVDQQPPFGSPLEQDKLINSVINLLSKTQTDEDTAEVAEESRENDLSLNNDLENNDLKNKDTIGKEKHEVVEKCKVETRSEESESASSIAVNFERGCQAEKDSLDGSPIGRRSFTQEEDDSGISLVDESDLVQESTMTNVGNFETRKECKNNERLTGVDDSNNGNAQWSSCQNKVPNTESEIKYNHFNNTELKHTKSSEYNLMSAKSNEPEIKYTKSSYESEDTTIGWQTRHKKMSKRRQDRDFERSGYYNDTSATESHRTPPLKRSSSKNKERSHGGYSKVASTEDRFKERNVWNSKRNEENESYESPKRFNRRIGQNTKKSDGKYAKNGAKEKHDNMEKQDAQNKKAQLQPNVFSYRDALLKDGSSAPSTKNEVQPLLSSKPEKLFNLESAVNYLNSVWTNVNNLHRKDPSKVHIYNGE